ncbi:hypothetical protein FACS18945_5280 [Bacteroidia bacterium]|nr:hypothetical protein FACS18945_5280 [Bacteroidia bacterium]
MPNIEPYKTPIPDVDEIENLHDFYIYKKEKVEEKDTIKISITKSKFLRLLKRAGFYKLYIDGLNASIVNISDNKMVTVSKDMITDIVHSYIRTLPVRSITVSTGKDQQMTEDVTPQKIIDALVDSTKSLVDKDTFLHISTIDESELLRDDEGVKYFYFNNTVVKVAKGAKPELMPYDTLTKKVWQSNIINRDYTPSDRKGYFEQFFEKITGMDDTRKKSLMSMMGYLLHNFLETDLFAIWITDVNPDFAERAGRTGKVCL